MPFRALRQSDKQPVIILDYAHPQVELDGISFCCPFCGEDMRIRGGNVRQYHFYHTSACPANIDRKPGENTKGGESTEHLELKKLVYERLRSQYQHDERIGFRIEEPIKVADVFRIADIGMIDRRTDQMIIAYELQLSPISTEQLQARTDAYESCGVDVVWMLGGKAATLTNIEWCSWNIHKVWEIRTHVSIHQAHKNL